MAYTKKNPSTSNQYTDTTLFQAFDTGIADGSPVNTMADLKALSVSNLSDGETRTLLGYYAANDGGGSRVFRYDTSAATSFSVSAANDTVTATAHPFSMLEKVTLYSLTGATGLATATTYYVINPTANTFKLASSWANALAGTAVNVTVDGSGSINRADDGGMCIVPASNPSSGRWISDTTGSWPVEAFGVIADGTDRTAEMTNALSARQVNGGRLALSARKARYVLAGPLPRVTAVIVSGVGFKQSEISHTGDNTLFDMRGGTTPAGGTDHDDPRGIERLKFSGNSGTSARAYVVGDGRSPVVRDVLIDGYTAGTAVELQNTGTTLGGPDLGTEGAQIENLLVLNTKRCFRMTRSTTGGSTYSFSDTRMRGCYFSVQNVANATAFYVGDGCIPYYGSYEFKAHSGAQPGAIAVHLDGTTFAVYFNDNFLNITYEALSPNPGTFVKMGAFDEFKGMGQVLWTTGSAPLYDIPSTAVYRVGPVDPWQSADRGNASVTLLATDRMVQRFDTTLGANQTVTLPTTGLQRGQRFKIVRTGAGAFSLTVSTIGVGGNQNIPASNKGLIEVQWNGTAWELIQKVQWT